MDHSSKLDSANDEIYPYPSKKKYLYGSKQSEPNLIFPNSVVLFIYKVESLHPRSDSVPLLEGEFSSFMKDSRISQLEMVH